MCSPKAYGLLAILVLNRVSILAILVSNRVWSFHSSLELVMFSEEVILPIAFNISGLN